MAASVFDEFYNAIFPLLLLLGLFWAVLVMLPLVLMALKGQPAKGAALSYGREKIT